MKHYLKLSVMLLALSMVFVQCSKDDSNDPTPTPTTETPKDPATAEKVSVDRFSMDAGMLFVRDGSNGLPAANAAINFDQAPFITQGLSADGSMVEYYNFDVMPTAPAPIYVLFKEGESTPVAGQLNIINKIPGESGYSDFWLVNKVTVPSSYVANTVTSLADIQTKGYTITPTTMVVNCPVVPEGSTATKRVGGGKAGLITGWYKGKTCVYFSFEEKALSTISGAVPTSPIYVSFNINPDMTGGGPASGFKMEMGSMQTHNVVATVPADATYSPLWSVNVYDNADFANVMDINSAKMANILAMGVAIVNCPIVSQ